MELLVDAYMSISKFKYVFKTIIGQSLSKYMMVTDKITDECIALGIERIWMQPGSRSEAAVKKAREAGIEVTDKGRFMSVEGVW